MSLHVRIATARKAAGMSYTDLAAASGVARGYLHLLEKGENSPTIGILEKIASALDISPVALLIDDRERGLMAFNDDELRLIEMYRAGDYPTMLRFIAGKLDT